MEKNIQKSIKRHNIYMVFQAISQKPRILRQEIAAKTGLSDMTVGKMINILLSAGLVVEEKQASSTPGRNPGAVSLQKVKRRILVIDLTGYNFRFGFLNTALEPEGPFSEHIYDSALSYADNLRMALSSMPDKPARRDWVEVLGVGVSVPGPYLADEDLVLTQLTPELGRIPLKSLLRTQIPDKPIYIDQDVYHSARYVGASRARGEYLFYAYVGRGVGGAVFYNGSLLRTANSYAGEFGQFRSAGGATVEELVSTAGIDFDAPLTEETRRRIDHAVTVLAGAFCDITWIIDPGVIVIETDYIRLAPDFIERLRDEFIRCTGEARRSRLPSLEGMPDSGSAHKGSALVVIKECLKQLT